MPITANVQRGRGCKISPHAHVGYKEHGGQILLGNHVTIAHDCVLRTCTGQIVLGDHVSVGYGTIMHALGGIIIEAGTLLSPRVQLYAQNHGSAGRAPIRTQKQTGKGIHVGKDAWLGAGVIVLDGVTIGEGAVIGAGAVVTRSVPPFEIWAGNPAKKIGVRA